MIEIERRPIKSTIPRQTVIKYIENLCAEYHIPIECDLNCYPLGELKWLRLTLQMQALNTPKPQEGSKAIAEAEGMR